MGLSLLQMVLAVAGLTTPFFNAAMQEAVDATAILHALIRGARGVD